MANLKAVSLKKQIEEMRSEEIAELNRKFDDLLSRIEDVTGIGNLVPANTGLAKSRKPRTPKAAPTTNKTPDTIPAPAPANDNAEASTQEQDASFEQSEQFHENCTTIRLALLDFPDGLGKSSILEATKLTESVAMASIRKMVEDGTVRPVGEKRGRKYIAVIPFVDQPPAATDVENGE